MGMCGRADGGLMGHKLPRTMPTESQKQHVCLDNCHDKAIVCGHVVLGHVEVNIPKRGHANFMTWHQGDIWHPT
eukprot:6901492-Pyramimonas_sp.AAC.1